MRIDEFTTYIYAQRKIKKAFCPPGVVEGNPVVDYVKHIIFGYYGKIDVAFQVRNTHPSTHACVPLLFFFSSPLDD